jgi:5-methylcytosine-specific restriction endonuclease McrA
LKTCPKCGSEHEKSGSYCCRSCANSRIFTAETNEKKRKSGLEFYSNFTPEERKELQAQKDTKFDAYDRQLRVQQKNLETSWSRPYEEMHHGSLRKRLLHEKNHVCEACGTGNIYNGLPLSLELDHIDGNNKNNKIENLRILCPNCHSQTPTHRAKNIKYKRLLKETIPQ